MNSVVAVASSGTSIFNFSCAKTASADGSVDSDHEKTDGTAIALRTRLPFFADAVIA